jgi:hypothetical protein
VIELLPNKKKVSNKVNQNMLEVWPNVNQSLEGTGSQLPTSHRSGSPVRVADQSDAASRMALSLFDIVLSCEHLGLLAHL